MLTPGTVEKGPREWGLGALTDGSPWSNMGTPGRVGAAALTQSPLWTLFWDRGHVAIAWCPEAPLTFFSRRTPVTRVMHRTPRQQER